MGAPPEPPLVSKLVAEFTGTFLLVFTIGCNILSKSGMWAGISIACVLMVAIFAFGAISGANFNPAVSVALGINGNLKWDVVGKYIGVQLAGGIAAGFGYYLLFANAFSLGPAKGFSMLSAGCCETLYTFMLCFVVLNVAAVQKGCQEWFGLAIGFVIVAGAYGAGAVSGGCFNPAVAFGIDVSDFLMPWHSIAYTAFELVGAALAAGLFKVVRPEGGTDVEVYSLTSKLVSEFIGTYILVLTVGLNVLAKSPAGAYSIAASLMCMIYALGDVSGANFNPAVSLALLINETLDASTAGAYMVVQILGGITAAFTYSMIHGGQSFPLGPQAGYGISQALEAEFMFTFVLCLVVLCCAVHDKTKSANFFALAIGSCVTVGGCAIGGISGGSLNPAVTFGIASAATLEHGGKSFLNGLFYVIVEFAGAAAAAGLVMVTHVSPVAVDSTDAEKANLIPTDEDWTMVEPAKPQEPSRQRSHTAIHPDAAKAAAEKTAAEKTAAAAAAKAAAEKTAADKAAGEKAAAKAAAEKAAADKAAGEKAAADKAAAEKGAADKAAVEKAAAEKAAATEKAAGEKAAADAAAAAAAAAAEKAAAEKAAAEKAAAERRQQIEAAVAKATAEKAAAAQTAAAATAAAKPQESSPTAAAKPKSKNKRNK